MTEPSQAAHDRIYLLTECVKWTIYTHVMFITNVFQNRQHMHAQAMCSRPIAPFPCPAQLFICLQYIKHFSVLQATKSCWEQGYHTNSSGCVNLHVCPSLLSVCRGQQNQDSAAGGCPCPPEAHQSSRPQGAEKCRWCAAQPHSHR